MRISDAAMILVLILLIAACLTGSAQASYIPEYHPWQITTDDNGNLYAIQHTARNIHEGIYVYTPDGRVIKSFPTPRDSGYKDIALDDAGNIYVYEIHSKQVVRLDESGNASFVWREDLPDHSIAYITTGYDGNLYVTDFNNTQGWVTTDGRILKISPNGTVLAVITGNVTMPFPDPFRVSVSPNGTMYLTTGGRSLRVIYPDGSRDIIIHTRPDNGTFNLAMDVVAGKDGYIYVCEMNPGRVQKLTTNGTLVGKWEGCGPERFMSLYGIAVDNSGRVYISDTLNQRIVWFDSNRYQFGANSSENAEGQGVLWDNVVAGDNYATANEIMKGVSSDVVGTPGFGAVIAAICIGLTGLALCIRKARLN